MLGYFTALLSSRWTLLCCLPIYSGTASVALTMGLALSHLLTHLSLTSPREAVNSSKERTDFPWAHNLQFLATVVSILNIKPSIILPGENGHIWEWQFGTCKLWKNHRPVQQTKERNVILWRRKRKLQRVVLKASPLEKGKSSG